MGVFDGAESGYNARGPWDRALEDAKCRARMNGESFANKELRGEMLRDGRCRTTCSDRLIG